MTTKTKKAEQFGVSRARTAEASSMSFMSLDHYGDKVLEHLQAAVRLAKKGKSVKVSTAELRKSSGIIETAFEAVIWWLWTTGKVKRVKMKGRKQDCYRSGEFWTLA